MQDPMEDFEQALWGRRVTTGKVSAFFVAMQMATHDTNQTMIRARTKPWFLQLLNLAIFLPKNRRWGGGACFCFQHWSRIYPILISRDICGKFYIKKFPLFSLFTIFFLYFKDLWILKQDFNVTHLSLSSLFIFYSHLQIINHFILF